MKRYISIRKVHAEPMNYAEAVNLGYIKESPFIRLDERGYHVRYADGRNSWVSKNMFDHLYFGLSGEEGISQDDVERFEEATGSTYEEYDACACLEFALLWAQNGIGKLI